MKYQWLVLNRKFVSGVEHYDSSGRPIILPVETEEIREILVTGNVIHNRAMIESDPVLGNLTRKRHVYRMPIQKRRKTIVQNYIREFMR